MAEPGYFPLAAEQHLDVTDAGTRRDECDGGGGAPVNAEHEQHAERRQDTPDDDAAKAPQVLSVPDWDRDRAFVELGERRARNFQYVAALLIESDGVFGEIRKPTYLGIGTWLTAHTVDQDRRRKAKDARRARDRMGDLLRDLVVADFIVTRGLRSRGPRAAARDRSHRLIGGSTRDARPGGSVGVDRLGGLVLAAHRRGVRIVRILGGLDFGRIEAGGHFGDHGAATHRGLEEVGNSLLEARLDVSLLFGLLGRRRQVARQNGATLIDHGHRIG